MEFIMHPWHLLVLALSALISHERERVIAYLITENQVLREKLGKGRTLLNDDQRRRLAVKGKVLGRKALLELATIGASEITSSALGRKWAEWMATFSAGNAWEAC